MDGFDAGEQAYFNAIFRANDGTGWKARHGMTGAEYQAEFDAEVARGWQLLHVDSYLSGGQVRYASIFVSTPGPAWVAYHGVSEATHQSLFNQRTAEGYRPVVISVVSSGGRRYTAFYEKRNVGSFWAKQVLSAQAYQTEFNAQAANGRKLVYINAYTDGGQPRFTAIWWSSPATWPYARHGLSGSQYQAEFDTQLGKACSPGP